MSELIEYLNKVEKDVKKWPSWKQKSLKEALQLSSKAKVKKSKISHKNSDISLKASEELSALT